MKREGWLSPSCATVLLLIAALVAGGSSRVRADDIVLTGGSLTMQPSSGPLRLEGDRGFTFSGSVSAFSGVFAPLTTCNYVEGPCSPGDRLSLRAVWSGSDLNGVATLDGVTYRVGGLMDSMLVEFAGSVELPPMAPQATVSAPFVVQGLFSRAAGHEQLHGSGLATLTLVPDPPFTARWRIVEAVYALGGKPSAPWISADVGPVGTPGLTSFIDTDVVVAGDGADIWGSADAFRYVYQATGPRPTITARIRSQEPTNPYAKAGVMLRASTDAGAAAVLLDAKPDGDLEFMVRYAQGEPMAYVAGATSPGRGVYLKLERGVADETTGWFSLTGTEWTLVGRAVVPLPATPILAGLAVTSHDAARLNAAWFDQVSVSGEVPTTNLLTRGDFEEDTPPLLGLPGWVSDDALRQVPAKSETNQPRSGAKNGACWTPGYLDCGIYQEVSAPTTGRYTLRIYASADRAGGLVGVNINGSTAAMQDVAVRPFGDYAAYTLKFTATTGDIIRVWMYSPGSPGYVVIDDASLLVASAPLARDATSGE